MSVLTQICAVFAICLVSEGISAALPFTLPSSIISMLILLLLLHCRVIRPGQLQNVSDFLLGNMPLFFIPAVAGILKYADVLFANFAAIFLISLLTTPLVFFVTGHAVQLTLRCLQRKEKSHD